MNLNRIRKITLGISIILHLLFLLSFKSIHSISLFNLNNSEPLPENTDQEKRIEFELVETPDDAIQQRPSEPTDLISDKNSIARDRYLAKDKPTGGPYSEGDFDIKNPEQPPPMPENNQSQTAQPNQYADADENFEQKYSQNQSYYSMNQPKFSRQALMGKTETPQSSKQEIQRPNYDSDEFNAKEIGGMAFNTYAWDFAPYMLHMKRKVERNVFPPPAFTHMGLIDGETIVRFKVLPNGEMQDLKVLQYKGHKALMETSVHAIENSSPFKPLPPDFPENYLEVTASFTYYIQR